MHTILAILASAGAPINVKLIDTTFDDAVVRRSPLAVALEHFLTERGNSHQLAAVCTLLRYGACLDNCEDGLSAEELVAKEEEEYVVSTSGNVHFAALKTVIKGVRAEGSWRKYCHRRGPHREILGLRSLAMRGCITPYQKRRTRGGEWKAVIAFIAPLGDNGIVWNIMSFWRDPDDVEEIATSIRTPSDSDSVGGGYIVENVVVGVYD